MNYFIKSNLFQFNKLIVEVGALVVPRQTGTTFPFKDFTMSGWMDIATVWMDIGVSRAEYKKIRSQTILQNRGTEDAKCDWTGKRGTSFRVLLLLSVVHEAASVSPGTLLGIVILGSSFRTTQLQSGSRTAIIGLTSQPGDY